MFSLKDFATGPFISLDAKQSIELPYLVAGFFLFTGLFFLFSALSRGVWKRNNIDYHDQWEWTMRCVSIFHSSVIGCVSIFWIHMLITRTDPNDIKLRGTMPYAGYVSDFSVSYFLWDVCAWLIMDWNVARHWRALPAAETAGKRTPRAYGELVLYFHHTIAISGQFASLGDSGLPIMYVTLLATECTTPFLNLLWVQDMGKVSKWILHSTAAFFLAMWIVFRLGMCGFGSWYMINYFELARAQVPPFSFWYCLVAIPFLSVLNWFWFYKIILKMFCKKPKKAAAGGDTGGASTLKEGKQN